MRRKRFFIILGKDYQPGETDWKIGLTSIWTHAVGLAPFKDTYCQGWKFFNF